VDTLNVWDEKLPEFDQEAIGAKYKGINKEPMDEAEQKVWDRIQELVARFKRADRLVIGVPLRIVPQHHPVTPACKLARMF
jgi:FMN-dependent NADH-azoreductase